VERLSENIEAPVTALWGRENIARTEEFTVEIGKYISDNKISSLLKNERV